MSLIFHRFPHVTAAAAFAVSAAGMEHGPGWSIHSSQESSNLCDPFPFELVPPIVLVDRDEDEGDAQAERLVPLFGGEFAGT